MQAPYEEHMEAINRILRYLKATPSEGLIFACLFLYVYDMLALSLRLG